MCFHSKQSKSAQELENRFQAKFDANVNYIPTIYNGFTFPKTPIITNKETNKIQLFNWGLIPSWAKDTTIRANTLNARNETINEKPSFRNSVKNRCMILADGFYEWQWLDDKGKKKQKYLITKPNQEPFSFAGLWNEWVDKATGEIIPTYTILTTAANEMMSEIHNTKKRMPVILKQEEEQDWLNGNINNTSEVELIAERT